MIPADAPRGLDAATLREAFDESFARLPPPAPAIEDFLSIPIGPEAWVIGLAEVTGVFAGRTITPLPAAASPLVGLAWVSGAMRPVFDLALLLGGPAAHAPRWLITAAAAPVAFACEEFGGHVRVTAASVGAGTIDEPRRHVRGWLTAGTRRPILDLRSVIADVRRLDRGTTTE